MSASRTTISIVMLRETDATVLESGDTPSVIMLRVKMTKVEVVALAALLSDIANVFDDETEKGDPS